MRLAFAAFLTMTAFDACGTTTTTTTTVTPPCCYADPPVGCRAMCTAPGDLRFVYCDGPGSGPRAAQFEPPLLAVVEGGLRR